LLSGEKKVARENMTVIQSSLSVQSADYQDNRVEMIALLERRDSLLARARNASEAARARFEKRGQLLPRERLSLLLDRGAPFLEICSLAGFRLNTPDAEKSVPGGGLIAGIGEISGVRCMILASDSGIEAGALQPKGLDKHLRVQQIALNCRLPYVQLVESAGANLMNYRVDEFVSGGQLFANLARMSAAGIPIVTVTHGSSTAGGAYQTGLSDYVIMVKGRTRAYLAGPPLLKAATGEVATEEELGGAEMHTAISGLGDFMAQDDREAIGMARAIVGKFQGVRRSIDDRPLDPRPPRYGMEELLGIISAEGRTRVDMREIIARIVDGSDFAEIGERYGSFTLCGYAAVDGWPVGIIANNGPIDADGAAKATHFIQACCQADIPLIYLQNITGYMVGRHHEQGGIIKHGSKMIQAVANATVPQITIQCGASFGAGNYGMCGRGFGPDFLFCWPTARTAVMGGKQAADTMANVAEAANRRNSGKPPRDIETMRKAIIETFDSQMDVFTTSAHVLDDGIIDPRHTRDVIALTLDACRKRNSLPGKPVQFGVARA
jgi:geranyl-CoA carboxylase beta subunit